MIHELDKRRSITLIQSTHYSSHRVNKQMNFDLTQESVGSSHSWSSPLALDECVKRPKKHIQESTGLRQKYILHYSYCITREN